MHAQATLRHPLNRAISAACAVAVALATLVACATSSPSTSSTNTLTYGLVGSAKDDISPWPIQRNVSQTVFAHQIYEGLTSYSPAGDLEYVLATSFEPNNTNDVWTINLREGVKFHDGSDFTADDVIYSIKWMLDPEHQFQASTQLNMIDTSGLEKIDDHTLAVHLTEPYGPFPQLWTLDRLKMSRNDTQPGERIGTGPWVLDDFRAQDKALFHRFKEYWGEQPGFENLKIVNFPDQTSMSNALRAGQIDIADAVPLTEVASLETLPTLNSIESERVGGLTLSMRIDQPPFDDKRVREAFHLIPDREQILANTYIGFGELGNDMNTRATGCPAPEVHTRSQDLERAKTLLEEAGATGLNIDLVTDGMLPGMMETAQLFAQHAADAGVTVNIKQLEVASFLSQYRDWPFSIGLTGGDYFSMIPSYFQPGGEQNITHFDDPEYNELARTLFATTDDRQQCELIAHMLEIEHERGGDIIPVLANTVIMFNSRVSGLEPDRWGRTAYEFRGVTLTE